MSSLTIYPPAKINLSLEVIGKRTDGFHDLKTLMVPIPGLHDTLIFDARDQFSFKCEDEGVPTDETNLVVRAARLYAEKAKVELMYQITLEKRIPAGAGLGGGSSDAAFTLLGLNELYGEALQLPELHELAAELGSDVPFFLYKTACICRGRGEIIEPLEQSVPFTICLLKPEFSVPTPDVFKRWKSSTEIAGVPYRAQDGPYGSMKNDLERPAFEKYLFLAQCKCWLLEQPEVEIAQMSGSGSTMYAIVSSVEKGNELLSRAMDELDPNLFSWCGSIGS